MNMGDSRVLHLCVENDALVTNGLNREVHLIRNFKCLTTLYCFFDVVKNPFHGKIGPVVNLKNIDEM